MLATQVAPQWVQVASCSRGCRSGSMPCLSREPRQTLQMLWELVETKAGKPLNQGK